LVVTRRAVRWRFGLLGNLPLGASQERRHRHSGHGGQKPWPRHIVKSHGPIRFIAIVKGQAIAALPVVANASLAEKFRATITAAAEPTKPIDERGPAALAWGSW
jgi:hypothetical protein